MISHSYTNAIDGEKKVSNFLFYNFYEKFKNTHFNIKLIKKITDKNTQIKGIDYLVTTDTKKYSIDEKAAITYPAVYNTNTNKIENYSLPTFAFELYTGINAFNTNDGWLFNKNTITDFYSINWVYLLNTDVRMNDYRNWWKHPSYILDNVENYLISAEQIKKSIIHFFDNEHQYNPEISLEMLSTPIKLKEFFDSIEIDRLHNSRKEYKFKSEPRVKLTQSLYRKECPINIVIKKDILSNISINKHFVSNTGYRTLK